MNWTLILTCYHTLEVEHLERSLYSLSKQTVMSKYRVFFDATSQIPRLTIRDLLDKYLKVHEWNCCIEEDGDPAKRNLSWNNNAAIRMAPTQVFVLCRADFVYDFTFCEKVLAAYANEPMSYATSWMFMMPAVQDLDSLGWRENPQRLLENNAGVTSKQIECWKMADKDGPSFCTSKQACEAAGWYDESFTSWGFSQQDIQSRMRAAGVKMKVIPEWLFFHMFHPAERDYAKAQEIWRQTQERRKTKKV
jgi:hypothetical protein